MLGTKKLWPLFLSESLRSVAISWLSVFSSVFIYRRMIEVVSSRIALGLVFLSWSIFGFSKIIGNCLAEELSLRRGLKLPLGLGLLFLMVSFILFNHSVKDISFVFPAKFFWGIAAGFYWFGWHGLVGKLGTFGEYGRAFGISSLLVGIAHFLAPMSGGLIINFWGYKALFLAAFGLTLLAFFVSLPLKGERTHQDTTIKEVLGLFATHRKAFLAYFSLGTLGVITSGCFVLYLALVLKKELALGEFFSLSVLLVALIQFFLGKLVDWQKREIVIWGSFMRSLVWLGRFWTKNLPLLLGLNVANDLAVGMVGMSMGVLTLEKAFDSRFTGRAVLFREVAISLGDAIAGIALGVLTVLGLPLTSGFVLAILLSLVPIFSVGGTKRRKRS